MVSETCTLSDQRVSRVWQVVAQSLGSISSALVIKEDKHWQFHMQIPTYRLNHILIATWRLIKQILAPSGSYSYDCACHFFVMASSSSNCCTCHSHLSLSRCLEGRIYKTNKAENGQYFLSAWFLRPDRESRKQPHNSLTFLAALISSFMLNSSLHLWNFLSSCTQLKAQSALPECTWQKSEASGAAVHDMPRVSIGGAHWSTWWSV